MSASNASALAVIAPQRFRDGRVSLRETQFAAAERSLPVQQLPSLTSDAPFVEHCQPNLVNSLAWSILVKGARGVVALVEVWGLVVRESKDYSFAEMEVEQQKSTDDLAAAGGDIRVPYLLILLAGHYSASLRDLA